MKKKALAISLIAISLVLASCGKKDGTEKEPDKTVNDNSVSSTGSQVEEGVKPEEGAETADENTEEPHAKIELSSNIDKSAYIIDKLYENKKENVLFSPMSLNMALGMVNNGATGSSKELINDYLGTDNYNDKARTIMDKYYRNTEVVPIKDTVYNESLKWYKTYGLDDNLANHLAKYMLAETGIDSDGYEYEDEYNEFVDSLYEIDRESHDEMRNGLIEYTFNNAEKDNSQFNVANSVWIANTCNIKPSFEDSVVDCYKADVANMDVMDSQGSADRINEWVSEKTHKLIESIINPSMITPETAAILVNSIYFNSNWIDEWVVKEGSFTDTTGNKTVLETISNTKASSYYENDDVTAFGIYYKNGFEFIGILPKSEGDFNISDINIGDVLNSEKTSDYDEVHAEMPRLKFETSNEMIIDSMKDLGMEELFGGKAHFEDLVQLEPGDSLSISDIIQKCTIDLDEFGTEASAATAIVMAKNAIAIADPNPKVAEVVLDRPFAFMIIDPETNEVAFLGKVVSVK